MHKTQIFSKLVSGIKGMYVTDCHEVEDVNLTKVTHKDLYVMKEQGVLIPGHKYRITNYRTTVFPYMFDNAVCMSSGRRFDIVVTAISENTISEDAYAVHHDFTPEEMTYEIPDEEFYTEARLDKWKLKYDMVNDELPYTLAYANKLYYPTEMRYRWRETEYSVWLYGKRDEALLLAAPPGGHLSDGYYHAIVSSLENNILQIDESSIEFCRSMDFIAPTGRILFLRDEFGNECWYDFKSILIKRNDKPYNDRYLYTFSDGESQIDRSSTGMSQGNVNKRIRSGNNVCLYIGKCIDNITTSRQSCVIDSSSNINIKANSLSCNVVNCIDLTILGRTIKGTALLENICEGYALCNDAGVTLLEDTRLSEILVQGTL